MKLPTLVTATTLALGTAIALSSPAQAYTTCTATFGFSVYKEPTTTSAKYKVWAGDEFDLTSTLKVTDEGTWRKILDGAFARWALDLHSWDYDCA